MYFGRADDQLVVVDARRRDMYEVLIAFARRRRLALAASPPNPECIYPPESVRVSTTPHASFAAAAAAALAFSSAFCLLDAMV